MEEALDPNAPKLIVGDDGTEVEVGYEHKYVVKGDLSGLTPEALDQLNTPVGGWGFNDHDRQLLGDETADTLEDLQLQISGSLAAGDEDGAVLYVEPTSDPEQFFETIKHPRIARALYSQPEPFYKDGRIGLHVNYARN